MNFNSSLTIQSEKKLWYAIGLLLFVYLILRAVFVHVMHDECATLFHYVFKLDFLPFIAAWDANNHVLNSALSSLFYIIFGDIPFIFRLPNVLSFVLYFISALYLSRLIHHAFLRNLFLATLLLTHGFIEFFGYTRGYGMSMAFLMAIVVSVHKLIMNPGTMGVMLYALWNVLAVWANLTLLPLLFASDIFLLIFFVVVKRKTNVTQICILVCMSVLKLLAVWFGFELSKRGALYYGGSDFYYLTIQRMQELLWGFYNWWTDAIILFLFVVIIFVQVFLLARKQMSLFNAYVSFLFLSALAAIFAQHFLLQTNYPEDRTAMYLFPLYVIPLFFSIDRLKKTIIHIVFIPFILLPLHFVGNINLKGSILWRYERVPESFYTSINKLYDRERPFLAGGHKLHGFQWIYYDIHQKQSLGPIQHEQYYDGLLDFMILKKEHEDNVSFNLYDVLESDSWSGNVLLKRKEKLKLSLISDSLIYTEKVVQGNEFTDILRIKTEEYTGKHLVLEVRGGISHNYRALRAAIIWSGATDTNPHHYYYIYFLDFYNSQNHSFRANYLLRSIPDAMEEIIVYIYNPKFQYYKINNINVRLHTVDIE